MTELEELTLDPPISPARILPGKAQDQLPSLRSIRSDSHRTPARVKRPLAANEFAVPANQRLRAHADRSPGGAREGLGQSGQDQAVGLLPPSSFDLALEYTELVAERKELSSKFSVGLASAQEDVDDETDHGVDELEKHGAGSYRSPSPNRQPGGGQRADGVTLTGQGPSLVAYSDLSLPPFTRVAWREAGQFRPVVSLI